MAKSSALSTVVGKINNSCCLHLASCPLPAALSLLQPARRPFLALPLITVGLSLSFPLYLYLYLSVFVLFVFVFVVSVSVFAFVCSTTFPRSLHNGRTSLHHPFVLFAFFLLAKLKGGVSLKVFIFWPFEHKKFSWCANARSQKTGEKAEIASVGGKTYFFAFVDPSPK